MKFSSILKSAAGIAAVLVGACSAAQSLPGDMTPSLKAFIEHPDHCVALVEKRVSYRMLPVSGTPDAAASNAYAEIMKVAGDETRQHNALMSLLSNCNAKVLRAAK